MTKRDIVLGIAAAWRLAARMGCDGTFSQPQSLDVNPTFRDIALSVCSYSKLYLCGLRERHYNFILNDYSYFQFSLVGDDEVRFAYYPNPFMGGAHAQDVLLVCEECLRGADMDLEDVYAVANGFDEAQYPPPLRYENSKTQYREFRHPCSHMHVGHHPDNRWAFSRVLTPKAFALLIFKQYYSCAWFGLGDGPHGVSGNMFESELMEERERCEALGDAHLSPGERRTFCFG